MNDDDKNIIINRYRDRLEAHGPGIKALSSGTTERRDIRFDVLNSAGDMRGKRVLDIGCGMADFHAWLDDRGIQIDYTGYDITPELIEIAASRFPNARFEIRDIQKQGIQEEFDYVVSSQTFNNVLNFQNNYEIMRDILRICYEASRTAVIVDMMTSYVDFREPHLFYYNPELIFRYAKSLTKRVLLRHDYPAYEFAIILYKDFEGWAK